MAIASSAGLRQINGRRGDTYFGINSAETPLRLLAQAMEAARDAGMPDTFAVITRAIEIGQLELVALGPPQFSSKLLNKALALVFEA
ncbi:hypothetical protein [Labrys wisconsinensis]|uniref:Uncharacterized protein n=1 Tax=Labrys wisconsinensis TaxID=425677 RepID=A0ABU0JMF4_9HYPH|nr:hypothetical protein [Labrys wisconsinensis]MDQ0475463.1 hypothetical protein [Labrys wisconsinensis]